MEIRFTFEGTLNGVQGVWCGFKPVGVVVTKVIPILYPDKDKKLRKKGDEELLDFVILKDGIKEEDYEEVEIEDAD